MVPSRDVFITPSLALGLIRVLVDGKPPDLALSGSSAWRGAQAGSDKIRSFPEKKRGRERGTERLEVLARYRLCTSEKHFCYHITSILHPAIRRSSSMCLAMEGKLRNNPKTG
jgi:hypothetical protein